MTLEAKQLRAMLERSQDGGGSEGELRFSEAERQRFSAAFDDPEFRAMFGQYLEELQDPAAREETEAYIAQLEGEQKVPPGKQLVRPAPAFCLKSFKTDETGRRDKLFINIVQSESIQSPRSSTSGEGTHWSVPYSLGPPRVERDRSGRNTTAFDCCFHPEAILIAEKQQRFRELLMSTAAEGVEQTLARQGSRQSVDRAALRVVKGTSYMRGRVPTMLIDAAASSHAWEEETRSEAAQSRPDKQPRAPALRKGFLLRRSTEDSSSSAVKTTSAEAPQVPRYSLKERGRGGLGDFETRGTTSPASARPAELVYRIELPLVFFSPDAGVADIRLDVGPRSLALSFLQVYQLSLRLPYEVEDTLGTVGPPFVFPLNIVL